MDAANAARFMIVLVLGFTLACGSAGSLPEYGGRGEWMFGSAEPDSVLHFIRWPEAPRDCYAENILGYVSNAVESSPESGCTAVIRKNVLGISCDLSPEGYDHACYPVYTGYLWVEEDRHSISNYDLVGVSWLRNTCGGSVYALDDRARRKLILQGGRSMRDLIRACRRQQTGTTAHLIGPRSSSGRIGDPDTDHAIPRPTRQ